MITRVRTISVYVKDQNRAVEFYTRVLGFEIRADQPMGPGARWIELAPPGAETMLVPLTPQGMEGRIGTFSGLVLACDDIDKTYSDLSAAGVHFTQPPDHQPWGAMAQFQDIDGNGFVLVEEEK